MATRTDDVGGAGRQRAAAHSMGGTGGIVGHGTGTRRAGKKGPGFIKFTRAQNVYLLGVHLLLEEVQVILLAVL